MLGCVKRLVGTEESAPAGKRGRLLPYINEREGLLPAAAEAWGHGGVSDVARAADPPVPTIRNGLR